MNAQKKEGPGTLTLREWNNCKQEFWAETGKQLNDTNFGRNSLIAQA